MSERPTSSRSMMTSQEVAYAKKITEYNKEPLMKTFTNMATQFSEKVQLNFIIFKQVIMKMCLQKILDLWECLSMMSKIPIELSIINADPLRSRNSPRVQAALIRQARSFLQDR
jgi:hypothetical protein